MKYKSWNVAPPCPEARALLEEAGTPPLLAAVLSARGVRTPDQARAAGVDSFWFKDYSEIELLEVMDLTVAGSSWYPQEKPPVPIGETVLSKLTKRQLDVLYALPDFVSTAAIAEELHISEETVKDHVRNLCQLTGCRSKASLLGLAQQTKLVIPAPKPGEHEKE